jgi:hypothetical protein
MLTLSEAVKTGRLQDFIDQEEAGRLDVVASRRCSSKNEDAHQKG